MGEEGERQQIGHIRTMARFFGTETGAGGVGNVLTDSKRGMIVV